MNSILMVSWKTQKKWIDSQSGPNLPKLNEMGVETLSRPVKIRSSEL